MRFWRRRPAGLALLTLAFLASQLWLGTFGPHTDDGCQTEIHCLACRTAFVRSSSAVTLLDATPTLVVLHDVHAQLPGFATEILPLGRPSRGPPHSS